VRKSVLWLPSIQQLKKMDLSSLTHNATATACCFSALPCSACPVSSPWSYHRPPLQIILEFVAYMYRSNMLRHVGLFRKKRRGSCRVSLGNMSPRRKIWIEGLWVQEVGRSVVDEKKISFLAETLPKLRFLWSFHLFGHHATWRVSPA
jgi:hypothetical protein